MSFLANGFIAISSSLTDPWTATSHAGCYGNSPNRKESISIKHSPLSSNWPLFTPLSPLLSQPTCLFANSMSKMLFSNLHSNFVEAVYAQQPSGFIDSAPRAWFTRITTFLKTIGFTASAWLRHRLYADHIIVTTSAPSLTDLVVSSLHSEFSMSDMGNLHYFLGTAVTRTPHGFFLSRDTPVNSSSMPTCITASPAPLSLTLNVHYNTSTRTLYRSLAGALQYLAFTRLEITHAVQQVCLHMHYPRDSHFALIKRILRYLHGCPDFGLQLTRSSCDELIAFSDADWAGCLGTCKPPLVSAFF
ncbi:LOW QUALITY PROTEIN: hypothetical protein U9M48_039247 [Paspalum notatum var. saurae]|uniref:Uncharacterized protein n=1 Tax=Paspalum notatum var. saurae TaxID=547442 RepID=A0AAQ3XD07_PASNO